MRRNAGVGNLPLIIDSKTAREFAFETIDKNDFGVFRNASMFELIQQTVAFVDDIDLVIVRSAAMQIQDHLKRDALEMVLTQIHHTLPQNAALIKEYCSQLIAFAMKRKASAAIQNLSANVGDNIAADVAKVADDLIATASSAVVYGRSNDELETELHDEFTGRRH